MISIRLNSLNYQRSKPSASKEIGIRKFEIVAKTQFLCCGNSHDPRVGLWMVISLQCRRHYIFQVISLQCRRHYVFHVISLQCRRHYIFQVISLQCRRHYIFQVISLQCRRHYIFQTINYVGSNKLSFRYQRIIRKWRHEDRLIPKIVTGNRARSILKA